MATMRRWAMVVGTGLALALMLVPASTAAARGCRVPPRWRSGWPVVQVIKVYGGATCRSATDGTRTLVESLREDLRLPPVAGVIPDLYRCSWRWHGESRRPYGTCRRGRKQFQVGFGV